MSAPTTASQSRTLTAAIIGNPNTGKSTLFNALAGMQSRVGNYPGVTVEKKIGKTRWRNREIRLVDLPGTYSLSPRSPDEMISVEVLLGRQPDVGSLDVVVCILDASNIERNLYLVSQVLDLGRPTVLVLNMGDVADARGLRIDTQLLAQRLGVPVVRTEAHRKRGLDDVREAILAASEAVPLEPPKVFPPEFYLERDALREKLHASNGAVVPSAIVERLMIDVGGEIETELLPRYSADVATHLTAARERLRESGCRFPAAEARVRYAWIREMLAGIVTHPQQRTVTGSDHIDRVLTHRVMGLIVFCAVMAVIFQAIYRGATPFMDAIKAVQGSAGEFVASVMPPGPFRSLLIDGVINGVGGVLVFLPQIVFLFFFIAILEDCGYMARAAFLMDRLMTKLGLSGKSFIPLMSSFACAIPGVMAARVIENRRDRMVTILVAPLMSCSARLPVYMLLITAFIPSKTYLGGGVNLQGLVLFGMYCLGALVAIPAAWLLKKTFFKGETPPFVMELPSYKWPSPRIVLGRVYDRGRAFVTRAGTLIFATSVIVWGAGYFPGDHAALDGVMAEIESLDTAGDEAAGKTNPRLEELRTQRNQLSSELIAGSFLGRAGHAIEPAVKPLGWDWRIGVGAIASFPAREVIISTLGTIYSLGGEVDEEDAGLEASLQQATWPDGRKVYNVPVALSIMVFFALCAQCAATLMVIRRETNSWLWPAFTFGYMTLLAYLGALVTYQVGMMFV